MRKKIEHKFERRIGFCCFPVLRDTNRYIFYTEDVKRKLPKEIGLSISLVCGYFDLLNRNSNLLDYMCFLWFLSDWHKRRTCPLRNCSTPCDLPIHLSTLLSPSASSAVDMRGCSMPAAKSSLDGSQSGFAGSSFPVLASTDGLPLCQGVAL